MNGSLKQSEANAVGEGVQSVGAGCLGWRVRTVLTWPLEGEVGVYKGEQESKAIQAQRG